MSARPTPLAYEIDQMRDDLDLQLYEVWPAMHGATPSNLGRGVAYFEATLIHAWRPTSLSRRHEGDDFDKALGA